MKTWCSCKQPVYIWKQPRCPSEGRWWNKLWYIHTVEYYLTIKKNRPDTRNTWKNLLEPCWVKKVNSKMSPAIWSHVQSSLNIYRDWFQDLLRHQNPSILKSLIQNNTVLSIVFFQWFCIHEFSQLQNVSPWLVESMKVEPIDAESQQYVTFLKRQNRRNREQISGCQRLRR